jgi:hypothetical protein
VSSFRGQKRHVSSTNAGFFLIDWQEIVAFKPGEAQSMVEIVAIQEDFPASGMPTVYADGVTTIQPTPEVIKFYLARIDPNLKADGRALTQPFAQVVMPMSGFLQTVAFFGKMVQNLIDQRVVTKEQVDEAYKAAGIPNGSIGR